VLAGGLADSSLGGMVETGRKYGFGTGVCLKNIRAPVKVSLL
jgi:hypothetical protein